MFDLHGKTALITGSNRGIGRSILLAYAQYGADVILHCRKPNERADQVIRQAEAVNLLFLTESEMCFPKSKRQASIPTPPIARILSISAQETMCMKTTIFHMTVLSSTI